MTRFGVTDAVVFESIEIDVHSPLVSMLENKRLLATAASVPSSFRRRTTVSTYTDFGRCLVTTVGQPLHLDFGQ